MPAADDRVTVDPLVSAVTEAVADGGHRMTVGARALDPADWIAGGSDLDEQLRERVRLLVAGAPVLAALDDTREA